MRKRTVLPGLVLLLLAPPGTPAAPARAPVLTVRLLLLRLVGPEGNAGTVRLEASFPPGIVAPDFDPEIHGVVVTIGPTVVTSLPPVGARASLRERAPFVWDYRERTSRIRSGRRSLSLDFTTGTLRFAARGVGLPGLPEAPPGPLPVTLTLGDVVCSASVEAAGSGRDRIFLSPGTEPPAPAPPRPAPPAPHGPEPPADTGPR